MQLVLTGSIFMPAKLSMFTLFGPDCCPSTLCQSCSPSHFLVTVTTDFFQPPDVEMVSFFANGDALTCDWPPSQQGPRIRADRYKLCVLWFFRLFRKKSCGQICMMIFFYQTQVSAMVTGDTFYVRSGTGLEKLLASLINGNRLLLPNASPLFYFSNSSSLLFVFSSLCPLFIHTTVRSH